MTNIYNSVSNASGKVPRAVFMKAAKKLNLSREVCQIAEEVLVLGYRQSTAARHAGVSRQRVHSICQNLIDVINAKKEGTDK